METNCNNRNVKRYVNSDAQFILNEFLDNQNSDIKEPGTFLGKVVDNMDPEKLGRCKIMVYTVFSEEMSATELPWAIPEFGFVGSKKGSFIVPAIGAIVKIEFENDEINLPKYSTKVLNTNQLPTNKDKNYPHNMIFFETDNGDSFEVDRQTSETTFNHSSGTTLSIDPAGNVTVDHVGTIKDTGGHVVPGPQGPMCAIAVCPLTNLAHIGQTCSPGVPSV